MDKKPYYNPAAWRSVVLTACVILLCAVIAVVITLLSGADKPAQPPVYTDPAGSEPETDPAPPTTSRPPVTTDRPVDLPTPPEADPSLPTVTPIVWSMPLEDAVLSKGHDLQNQVYSQTMNDYRVHCGVDLQTVTGADVLAVADGVVENIYVDPFEGTCLRIGHRDGYVSVYKNLAPALLEGLKEGDSVQGGQTLGSVGESAIIEISDEPHLHLEMFCDGRAVDPLSLLPYLPGEGGYGE